MKFISIKVNGEEKTVEKGILVKDMLARMHIAHKIFVVERNMEILPKEQYSSCVVEDEDSFEIVGFFGGG